MQQAQTQKTVEAGEDREPTPASPIPLNELIEDARVLDQMTKAGCQPATGRIMGCLAGRVTGRRTR